MRQTPSQAPAFCGASATRGHSIPGAASAGQSISRTVRQKPERRERVQHPRQRSGTRRIRKPHRYTRPPKHRPLSSDHVRDDLCYFRTITPVPRKPTPVTMPWVFHRLTWVILQFGADVHAARVTCSTQLLGRRHASASKPQDAKGHNKERTATEYQLCYCRVSSLICRRRGQCAVEEDNQRTLTGKGSATVILIRRN
jgi:hypothetical protein